MTPEQLKSIQTAAEDIRGWQRLRYVWWLQTFQAGSEKLQLEENVKTWDQTLAPILQKLMAETGLPAHEALMSVESWLNDTNKKTP